MMRMFISVCLLLISATLTGREANNIENTEMVFGGQVSDSRRAELFGLSETEWAKYKEIMAGPRGLWTPDLSPIYVLGLHSEPNSAQRRAYMEKMVETESKRITQEMNFIKEYRAFFNEYHKNLLPIDEGQFMGTQNIVMTNDRFVILINGSCVPCLMNTKQELAKLESFPKNGRDYYFVGASSERHILEMAKALSIDVNMVSSGRYTLNPQSNLGSYLDKARGFSILIRRNDDLYPANFVGL